MSYADESGEAEKVFSQEKGQATSTYAQDPTPQKGSEKESDEVDRLVQNETQLYPTRVNNMRMQFAWAAIVLAYSWIFTIIFIILSHGVGRLHLHPFRSTTWGMSGTLISAIVVYCFCMIKHARKRHLGAPGIERRKRALFWREVASPASFLISPIFGFACFFIASLVINNHGKYPFIRLTDSVLITLITSTTVSVLGILGAVMWWLFPRKEKTY